MKKTILIVDDEVSQLRMAEFVVGSKLQYNVITAGGGQEAIDLVTSGSQPMPDLMLLDLMMPGVGGLDVLRAVKAFRPQLPIIVFTQYGDNENAARAVELGANDFLNKPVVLERLRLSILNALTMQRLVSYIEQLGHSPLNKDGELSAFLDGQGRLKPLQVIEEEAIRFAVEHCAGCMTRAARSLGIGRSTLYRKIDGMERHIGLTNQRTKMSMQDVRGFSSSA